MVTIDVHIICVSTIWQFNFLQICDGQPVADFVHVKDSMLLHYIFCWRFSLSNFCSSSIQAKYIERLERKFKGAQFSSLSPILEPPGSLRHQKWLHDQFPRLFSVLHCPLRLGELQVCPFLYVVFPPLLLSALSSSPFHCAYIMVLARPDNGEHVHTTSVCVSLRCSEGLRTVQFPDGSWDGPPRW